MNDELKPKFKVGDRVYSAPNILEGDVVGIFKKIESPFSWDEFVYLVFIRERVYFHAECDLELILEKQNAD